MQEDTLKQGAPSARPRPTIHDVARELGVSARTVSRIMNDQPGVSAGTRARLAPRIAELGYAPHAGARRLRMNWRVEGIGVTLGADPAIVPLSDALLSWLFQELYDHFGARGEFISFDLHGAAQDAAHDYARGLWQDRFGALVIAGALADEDTTLARVHAAGHPYVALCRLYSQPDAYTATVDFERAAYESVALLAARGHRRIGMVRPLAGYQPGTERLRGYQHAHEALGLPYDSARVASVDFRSGTVYEAATSLLHDRTVTALIDASGHQDAKQLRNACTYTMRQIGRDVDVVVWTYDEQARVLGEAYAHVALPVRAAAVQGLAGLAARMYENVPQAPVLLSPRVFQPPAGPEAQPPQPVFRVTPRT